LLDYQNNEINLLDEEKKAFEVLTRIINTIVEGAEVNKVFSDQDYTVFEISKVDPGIVIGKHGHTLDAIQYLVNMIANKERNLDTQRLYVIDIDGYRKRREESLKRYAKEKAEIVKRRGNAIALYFMNSIERRLIHLSLKEDPEVTTYSEGKDPFRRVIISPAVISKTDYGQRDE